MLDCGSTPFVVGVGGPSASGKTTFCRALQSALGQDDCLLLSHDDYYRDLSRLPLHEREQQDFDRPEALETDLLVEHLRRLRAGHSVEKPLYDFTRHTRRQETDVITAAAVILIEGIFVLACPALREACDLLIYIDTPADICLARRVLRDVRERGRTVQFAIDQYLRTVRPAQQEWVLPAAQYAQTVVASDHFTDNVRRVERLIQERTGRRFGGSHS